MNKNDRKELQLIINKLEDLRLDIENIRDQEQDKNDNTPENLQGSEKYEQREECINYLEDASEGVDDIIENLTMAIG
jgi:hypothetical protein